MIDDRLSFEHFQDVCRLLPYVTDPHSRLLEVANTLATEMSAFRTNELVGEAMALLSQITTECGGDLDHVASHFIKTTNAKPRVFGKAPCILSENSKVSLLPSERSLENFVIQITGLNGEKAEDKIELRGANLYPLPEHDDTFILVPIFPPVFQEGYLRCLNTISGVHYQLTWFIDTNRNIYMCDFFGNGAVLKNGEWIETNSPFFIPSMNACIHFLGWLESEIKRIEKEDALIQTLIVINDENSTDFPRWLIEMPFFLEKWLEYKSNYANLCLAGQSHTKYI